MPQGISFLTLKDVKVNILSDSDGFSIIFSKI